MREKKNFFTKIFIAPFLLGVFLMSGGYAEDAVNVVTDDGSNSEISDGINVDTRTDEQKAADLAEKQGAYDSAYATQQSTANKLLGGLTTAATGLGTMEALRGLAEQQADKKADADMDAYIATMRCSYADGKSVKAGLEPIELPGGNDENLMKYRNEYIALATSLKTRKESLGMKPGIESELILDKADMGLYDQENIGIEQGKYSSLYRAKMQNSETDQTQIAEEAQKSANRLKYGAIAAGAGVAVGVIGNSAINGKLGEWIKRIKQDKNARKTEKQALADLKKCLKDAGVKNYDNLDFNKFSPSVLNLENINCKEDLKHLRGQDATSLIVDSDDGVEVTESLVETFGEEKATAMLSDVVDIVPVENANAVDFGQGLKRCGLSVEGARWPVRTSSDEPLTRCDYLEKGEWRVEFAENRSLEGVSVCSANGDFSNSNGKSGFVLGTVPDAALQKKIQKDYSDWVNSDRPNIDYTKFPTKVGCYCKTNETDAKWVFLEESSASGCKTNCAWDCGGVQTKNKTDGGVDFTKTLVAGVRTIYD